MIGRLTGDATARDGLSYATASTGPKLGHLSQEEAAPPRITAREIVSSQAVTKPSDARPHSPHRMVGGREGWSSPERVGVLASSTGSRASANAPPAA